MRTKKMIYCLFGLCGIGILSWLWYKDILPYNYALLFAALLIVAGKALKIN